MLAAQNNHLEVVKQLISSGARVNATNQVSVKIKRGRVMGVASMPTVNAT